MIREVAHPAFKILAACEQLVFAASHGSDGVRNVLLHGLRRAIHEIEEVHSLMHLVLVVAPACIKNVGERRRKRQCINERITPSNGSDSVFDFYFASVIAGLADQQQHT